jgi:transposase-like zinc-binding protein
MEPTPKPQLILSCRALSGKAETRGNRPKRVHWLTASARRPETAGPAYATSKRLLPRALRPVHAGKSPACARRDRAVSHLGQWRKHCGYVYFGYHSCNHRSCPKCGGADAQTWLDGQYERLLPVPYFLITFTLPEQLSTPCRSPLPEVKPLSFPLHGSIFQDHDFTQVRTAPSVFRLVLSSPGVPADRRSDQCAAAFPG